MSLERLDKIIASQTALSRNDVRKAVRDGRVSIDGVRAVSADSKTDPERAEIYIDGEKLIYSKFVYIMLNKPAGIVSASRDAHEKTVADLAPEQYRTRELFPAGRLDRDTTGFILLTDDGAFAHRILSPKNHIAKTYTVTLSREVSESETAEIEAGLVTQGECFLPAELKLLNKDENIYEIKICEGKYHQIKRMFAHFGNPVTALRRTKMGSLELDSSLGEGDARILSADEIRKIEE